MKMYVIKDSNTGEYYRRSFGNSGGWFGLDKSAAKLYSSQDKAQQTIQRGGFKVTYSSLGPRTLVVDSVEMT